MFDAHPTYSSNQGTTPSPPLPLPAWVTVLSSPHRVVAKTFCLDFLSIVLAFASGVIFGGVVQGALVSTACATIASGLGFQLARTKLRTQVETQVRKRTRFFFPTAV